MLKFFERLFEIIGCIEIVFSPFSAGVILGLIVYYNLTNTLGLILGIALAVCGLVLGMVWATRIWKRTGTQNFLSGIHASPDIDAMLKEQDAIKKPQSQD